MDTRIRRYILAEGARHFEKYLNDTEAARTHDATPCDLSEGSICRWKVQPIFRPDTEFDKASAAFSRAYDLQELNPGHTVKIFTMPTLECFENRGHDEGSDCYVRDLVKLKTEAEYLGAKSKYDPALLDYLMKMSGNVDRAYYGTDIRVIHEHICPATEASSSSATIKDRPVASSGRETEQSTSGRFAAANSDVTVGVGGDEPSAYTETDPNARTDQVSGDTNSASGGPPHRFRAEVFSRFNSMRP